MTTDLLKDKFGPIFSDECLRGHYEILLKIEALEAKHITPVMPTFTPTQHLFLRQLYTAKTTSASIHLLNSWLYCIPALGLLRMRVEQCIINSYLIHEDRLQGLQPFVQHLSISRLLSSKEALNDDRLAPFLPDRQLASEVLRSEAVDSQLSLDPAFDPATGRFQRKWTSLDLRSMCLRRDQLVRKKAEQEWWIKDPLELTYITVYRLASSVGHADCESLSFHYLDVFPGPDGHEPILMADPRWAPTIACFCSMLDILQFFETARWLGTNPTEDCQQLKKDWIALRERTTNA
jgi:hypothetical protein